MALLSFWAPIERRRTRNATLVRSTTTKGLCGGIRHICIYGYLYATVWVILSCSRLVCCSRIACGHISLMPLMHFWSFKFDKYPAFLYTDCEVKMESTSTTKNRQIDKCHVKHQQLFAICAFSRWIHKRPRRIVLKLFTCRRRKQGCMTENI